MAIGQTLEDVKLVSIQSDQAIFEVEGKKPSLYIGRKALGGNSAKAGGQLVLIVDNQGHFFATDSINGASAKFLVDTGATMISLGATDARRIGIDGNQGRRSVTQTANGQAS